MKLYQGQGHQHDFQRIAEFLVPSQAFMVIIKCQPLSHAKETQPVNKKPAQVPNQPTSNHGEIAARQGRHGDLSIASTYSCKWTAHRGTQGRVTKNACLLQLYQNNMSTGTHRGRPQYIAMASNKQTGSEWQQQQQCTTTTSTIGQHLMTNTTSPTTSPSLSWSAMIT